jgi:hypothetical protein
MLEKIDFHLNELMSLCEEYKKQKPWFRQKNSDLFIDLKKNKAKLNEIKMHVKAYDASSVLGRLWMGLRYPIGYYRETLQYYALDELIQQVRSAPAEERVFFLDDIISFLEKFSLAKIKNSISKIYKSLVSAKSEFNADSDADVFSVVSVENSKSSSIVTVSTDKTPENLQEIKHHNVKIVRNMIDLLNEMQAVDWRGLSEESEDTAKQKYDGFMRKFEVVLRAYSHLRILTHPDHHGTNESADLFRELQATYKKFKDYKEKIKKYVNANGLALLNDHLPKEEQSAKDLLDTLNMTLDALIRNYDKYSKIFEELLPGQNEDLKILIEEVNDQSKAVDVLKKESVKQDKDIETLKKDVDIQSEELKKLREASNFQAAQLRERLKKDNELDDKIHLSIEEKLRKFMGNTSLTEGDSNTNLSTGGAFFERGRTSAHKDADKKPAQINTDKKEHSIF